MREPMRVSDLRALLVGVSDDAFVSIRDEEGHGSPADWFLHEGSAGEPQQIILVAGQEGD